MTGSAFVSWAITAGIAARTTGLRVCNRNELICVLPFGVAFNSAGMRRLIWDGRHVNAHLRKRQFRVETVQREGRALFERSTHGGTLDTSSDYHHLDMAENLKRHPLPRIRVGGRVLRFRSAPLRAVIGPVDFHDSDGSLREILVGRWLLYNAGR